MDLVDILPRFETIDGFLAWEKRQEARFEFDGADVVPMTGGTKRHQFICGNIFRVMFSFASYCCLQEMRVRVGGKIRYPDISIVNRADNWDVGTLTDALVVMEVLSPDTMDTDLEVKVDEYFLLPSLRSYIVISQEERLVRRMRRGEDWETVTTHLDLELEGEAVRIPVSEIYARVGL